MEALGVGNGEDILIVDDDDLNLLAITAALEPLGRRLVHAHSGIEALAKLLDQDFALILLDVAMPGMSGIETAAMIRARERCRCVPIIFVTGMAWQDDVVVEGYEAGGFDFLIKPIRPDLLRAKARVFLQLQETTRELQVKELARQREHYETVLLEQRVAQLAELDRRKDERLAILGHELRNPLQSLQMAVALLSRCREPSSLERASRTVELRVGYMARLVDDLMDAARLNAGTLELLRDHHAVHDLVRESIDMCSALGASRELAVTFTPDEPSPVIDGDRVRLIQVFANLVQNALRYTPPGGSITVTVEGDTDVVVRVADTGRGIRADLLPNVFDMFVRDRASSDTYGGLGLGLSLVRQLVELHGGSVGAASPGPDHGSTFTVRLPASTAKVAIARTQTPRPQSLPLRVLVCDDADDIRELVADSLRLDGHFVTVAANGTDAIDSIVADPPDVALIDLGLPDVSGQEVARAVRAQLGARSPRLIAVTGYAANDDALGFDQHLIKPTSMQRLREAIFAR